MVSHFFCESHTKCLSLGQHRGSAFQWHKEVKEDAHLRIGEQAYSEGERMRGGHVNRFDLLDQLLSNR